MCAHMLSLSLFSVSRSPFYPPLPPILLPSFLLSRSPSLPLYVPSVGGLNAGAQSLNQLLAAMASNHAATIMESQYEGIDVCSLSLSLLPFAIPPARAGLLPLPRSPGVHVLANVCACAYGWHLTSTHIHYTHTHTHARARTHSHTLIHTVTHSQDLGLGATSASPQPMLGGNNPADTADFLPDLSFLGGAVSPNPLVVRAPTPLHTYTHTRTDSHTPTLTFKHSSIWTLSWAPRLRALSLWQTPTSSRTSPS